MRPWLALLLVSGCFYVDPINQRPSLDIERDGSGEIYRGEDVKLNAIANDPENQLVFFQWRGYACNGEPIPDATGPRPGCDAVPFYTEILQRASFTVPMMRADSPDQPVQQIVVLLEGQDEYGAYAKPIQQLVLPVSDHAPTLALRKDSRFGYVVDHPINIYAKIGDPDDDKLKATLDWKVYTPMTQPLYDLTDPTTAPPQDPNDPAHVQVGKVFTPHGTGDWEIEVTVMDPLGNKTTDSVMISVVPDHAPCLSQWSPIASGTTAYPMTDPTLFQVTVVQDDLDPWPAVPGDTELQPTTFHWSLLPPGASARQALAVSGNGVSLDPASYSPGDVLELRVEIADRKNTPITCSDASPTCSVISDNSCIQRLTWKVEVR